MILSSTSLPRGKKGTRQPCSELGSTVILPGEATAVLHRIREGLPAHGHASNPLGEKDSLEFGNSLKPEHKHGPRRKGAPN